jgi:hypothetical protein
MNVIPLRFCDIRPYMPQPIQQQHGARGYFIRYGISKATYFQ